MKNQSKHRYNIISRGGTTFSIAYPDTLPTESLLWTLTDDTQQWQLHDAGGGYIQITAKNSETAYIDLENGNAVNDGKVQIWNNGFNTKWKVVEVL